MVELRGDPDEAEGHQQVGDVGIGQGIEHPVAPFHLNRDDQAPRSVQSDFAARGLDLPAVDLLEELLHARRDHIDHLELERFLARGRHALHDRIDRPLHISASVLGYILDHGDRIVLDLLSHIPFDVLTLSSHGMGGPDVGVRRHGGHMGCHGDEDARAGGPGSDGGDIHHDRDGGVEHLLDDVLGRREHASRRVQLDDQAFGPLQLGPFDTLCDELQSHGVDDALDMDKEYTGRFTLSSRAGRTVLGHGDYRADYENSRTRYG